MTDKKKKKENSKKAKESLVLITIIVESLPDCNCSFSLKGFVNGKKDEDGAWGWCIYVVKEGARGK